MVLVELLVGVSIGVDLVWYIDEDLGFGWYTGESLALVLGPWFWCGLWCWPVYSRGPWFLVGVGKGFGLGWYIDWGLGFGSCIDCGLGFGWYIDKGFGLAWYIGEGLGFRFVVHFGAIYVLCVELVSIWIVFLGRKNSRNENSADEKYAFITASSHTQNMVSFHHHCEVLLNEQNNTFQYIYDNRELFYRVLATYIRFVHTL